MTNNKSKKKKSVSIKVCPSQVNDLLLRFGHNFQYYGCNIRKRKLEQHSEHLENNVEKRIDRIIGICLGLNPNFNVKKPEHLSVFLALDEKESEAFISAKDSHAYEKTLKELDQQATEIYKNLTASQPQKHTEPHIETAHIETEISNSPAMNVPVISEPSIKKLVKVKKPKFYQKLLSLHTRIENQPEISIPFLKPVAEFEDVNHQKYQGIIKNPIDLRTIRQKLNNVYTDPWDYIYDMNLMFENCRNFYRNPNVYIIKCCESLFQIFDKKIQELMLSEGYCCGSASKFDGRLLNCGGRVFCKIPLDSVYYSHEGYLFCECCFNNYDQHVEFGNGELVPKTEFSKEFNKGECREPFVTCGKCEKTFHQLCVLLYPNMGHTFICKRCRSGENSDEIIVSSRNLPETECSKMLEQKMKELLNQWSDGNQSEYDYIDKTTIRCISEHPKKLETKPNLSKFIKCSLDYLNRTIFAFIQVGKHDVVFFGIHLHLFPDKNYAYLAYMDSVLLIKESKIRRKLYQAILLALFDYLKSCGFQKIFIWSCPPKNRDDYIFHIKPKEQKTLTQVHLNQWYERLFDAGCNEGIIHNYYHVIDHIEMFEKIQLFEAIPYFEGDLWNLKIEELIKLCMKDADRHSVNALADRFNLYKNQHKRRKTSEFCKEEFDFQNEFLTRLMEVMNIFKSCYYIVDIGNRGMKKTVSYKETLPKIEVIDDRISFLKYQIKNSLQHCDRRRMVHSASILLCKIFSEHKICIKCGGNTYDSYPNNLCIVCLEHFDWEDVPEPAVPTPKKRSKKNKSDCDIASVFVNILTLTKKIRKINSSEPDNIDENANVVFKKNENFSLKKARTKNITWRKNVKFKHSKKNSSLPNALLELISLFKFNRMLQSESFKSEDMATNYENETVNITNKNSSTQKKTRGRKATRVPERYLLSKSKHLNLNNCGSTSKFYMSTFNRVVEFKECYVLIEKIASEKGNLKSIRNIRNTTKKRWVDIVSTPIHIFHSNYDYYRDPKFRSPHRLRPDIMSDYFLRNLYFKMHKIGNRIISRDNLKRKKLNFHQKPKELDESDFVLSLPKSEDNNNNCSTFEMTQASITQSPNVDTASENFDLKPKMKRVNRLALESSQLLLSQLQMQDPLEDNRDTLKKSELMFNTQPNPHSPISPHLWKPFCTSTPKQKLILNFNHSQRMNLLCNCNDVKCENCDPLKLHKPF